MQRTPLLDGWSCDSGDGFGALFAPSRGDPVALPHDAMVLQGRSSENGPGGSVGYYPTGSYVYTRTLDVPADWQDKSVALEFEGVYANAMVYVNGQLAGQRPYGYSEFTVNLRPYLRFGAENEIKVKARTSTDGESRWYSGGGLYRPVHLLVAGLVHIATNGVQITTVDIDGIRGDQAEQAVVEVTTTVVNEGSLPRTVTLVTELCDAVGNVVASDGAPVTAFPGDSPTVRQRMLVAGPRLWSPDTPNLYACRSRLVDGDDALDAGENAFGIRRLQLDGRHGLRINGEPVLLRGGCIHHDNGVVGAATFAHLEERRVAIMKAAGFNAIRSAHNPLSRAMLDACDRLGMLVMDETFDMWTESKRNDDYSLHYAEWWERDVEAMVAKDYNHPSVVLYSIGNEILELGSPLGAALGRRQAEKIRSLDGTRYITNGINAGMAVMRNVGEIFPGVKDLAALAATLPKEAEATNTGPSTGDHPAGAVPAENPFTWIHSAIEYLMNHPRVWTRLDETSSILDVVGLNYARSRYEPTSKENPQRLMVGSETYVPDIDLNWALVERLPQVLGDFCWTAWDYLGEAGGRGGGWPRYFNTSGVIDLAGHRKPASYHREIVWGLRCEPYIAVQRPATYGQSVEPSPWAWSDSIASWTWPGFENKPVVVEVYADGDEVELLLNGRSVGRAPAGEANRFRAFFDVTYEPGELVAVAYRSGTETGRTLLLTAGPGLALDVACDRDTLWPTGDDVACVAITLTDGEGNVRNDVDRTVKVTVEGAGTLQGLGNANPLSEEQFSATECTTYDGRALAVVRAGREPGTVSVRVTAEGCAEQVITIAVG
ncbi:MAG: glycoside hydrolase family 2 TIM barrel-domain containing protein [Anaerolineae bacterium]